MIAVSTAWNARKHDNVTYIVEELKSLGFRAIELNVQMSEDMLYQIEDMLPEIVISSLHNFCPVPEGTRLSGSGDFYPLASTDPKERARAVNAAKRTVDWAKRLGAKAVVLHCGKTPAPCHPQEIWDLRLSGRHDEADKILKQDLEERERIKEPFLNAALQSIADIAEYAAGDVRIGVETRLVYHEIPSLDEIELFMDLLPPDLGGYWHDFGHAHLNELAGSGKHEEFVRRYGKRAVGMHVHDVLGKQDHGPLTHETIDFAKLMQFMSPEAISVLEIHRHATSGELAESRRIWEALTNDK